MPRGPRKQAEGCDKPTSSLFACSEASRGNPAQWLLLLWIAGLKACSLKDAARLHPGKHFNARV